jgi:hypothetical protein
MSTSGLSRLKLRFLLTAVELGHEGEKLCRNPVYQAEDLSLRDQVWLRQAQPASLEARG